MTFRVAFYEKSSCPVCISITTEKNSQLISITVEQACHLVAWINSCWVYGPSFTSQEGCQYKFCWMSENIAQIEFDHPDSIGKGTIDLTKELINNLSWLIMWTLKEVTC